MTEPVLPISSPADLLALVPCVLGFHPADSLVLVVVSGAHGNLHARVDLPEDPDELDDAVAALRTALVRNGARSVALIAYTDDPLLAEDTVWALEDALGELGVAVLAALRADGSRWFCLDCAADCCPPDGRPYDLGSHPITAANVLDGRVTWENRDALAASLEGEDAEDRAAVAAAADDAGRRLRTAERSAPGREDIRGVGIHLVAEGRWVRDRVRRNLSTGEPLDAAEAGRLAVAIAASVQVRDVAWSEMDRDNAERHVELWRDLVRRVPADLLAAPAALLGFAAWLSGDGALAWCAVDRCRRVEPDYSLAGLLAEALVQAVPPSTWTPVPSEELPLFAG